MSLNAKITSLSRYQESSFTTMYITRFEFLKRFFLPMVQEQGAYELFLKNSWKAICQHTLEIMSIEGLNWSKLLEKATYYGNCEPRDEEVIKK